MREALPNLIDAFPVRFGRIYYIYDTDGTYAT